MNKEAKFSMGQLVQHTMFGYRGVIFELDPYFMLSDEWYAQVALSRPPKDEPWYNVLVDNVLHTTYVAERNLIASKDLSEIQHPDLKLYFESFKNDHYLLNKNHIQ
ncbi:MAG: heat shock protein HspQ [Pseudohongiellaceae bacterium]|jgi:heat shock protein HspQ